LVTITEEIWAKRLAMHVSQTIQHESVTRHKSLALIVPFLTFCLLLITFLQLKKKKINPYF
jgi:hypothetical protein